MGRYTITTLVKKNAEGQSASNYGICKAYWFSVYDFLCKMTASKTKPAKYEDLVVLQVLMAKHYSAASIHLEIYTYEQILRIKKEL